MTRAAPARRACVLGAALMVALAGCARVGGPEAGRPLPGSAGAAGVPPVPHPSVSRPPEAPAPVRSALSADGRAPVPDREVRALWVVRTALVHPDSIRVMVTRAADSGFNTLLVQVRGRGDAFYAGGPEPRAVQIAHLPATFDPLETVIREARARGLEVHAWVNTHLVASALMLPTDAAHIALAHPEWLAVPRELARELHGVDPRSPRYLERLARFARDNSTRVEGVYSSPANPLVAEHVVAVWRHLLTRYALDGVHLDYVRYPAPDFDYSKGALDAFRAWAGGRVPAARRDELDAAARRDPLAWVEALPEEWGDFRRGAVTALVERVAGEARRLRPGIRVSAAVFPDAREARRDRLQDWGDWMARGVIDAVAPMAYTPNVERFRGQIREAVALAGPGRVWAGLGIYQTTFPGAVTKAEAARGEGVGGLVLFSYDWAVAEGGRVAGGPYLDRISRELFRGR